MESDIAESTEASVQQIDNVEQSDVKDLLGMHVSIMCPWSLVYTCNQLALFVCCCFTQCRVSFYFTIEWNQQSTQSWQW